MPKRDAYRDSLFDTSMSETLAVEKFFEDTAVLGKRVTDSKYFNGPSTP